MTTPTIPAICKLKNLSARKWFDQHRENLIAFMTPESRSEVFALMDEFAEAVLEDSGAVKLQEQLDEAQGILDAIAADTSHADDRQKTECEKAELVNALQDLLGLINTFKFPIYSSGQIARAETVIRKYGVPA